MASLRKVDSAKNSLDRQKGTCKRSTSFDCGTFVGSRSESPPSGRRSMPFMGDVTSRRSRWHGRPVRRFAKKQTSLGAPRGVEEVDVPRLRRCGCMGGLGQLATRVSETGFLGNFPKSDWEVSRYDLLQVPTWTSVHCCSRRHSNRTSMDEQTGSIRVCGTPATMEEDTERGQS